MSSALSCLYKIPMAIAYDNSQVGNSSSQSPSASYTVTGTKTLLVVTVTDITGNDNVTSVTYNGVAMTQKYKAQNASSGYYQYVYCLLGAATGSNTLQITRSAGTGNTVTWSIASYTGVSQNSGALFDSSNSSNGTTTSGRNISTTTVADNCWTFLTFWDANGNNPAAGSGSTQRAASSAGNATTIFDSNGAVTPAGSKNMAVGNTGASIWGMHIFSFAPDVLKTKDCSETLSLTDTKNFSVSRSLSETLTNTDTVLKQPIKVLSETLTESDTVATLRIKFINPVETLSLTDIVSRLGVFGRTLTETLTGTDSVSALRISFLNLMDNVSLSDVMAFQSTLMRTLTESITLTDIISISNLWTYRTKPTSIWTNRTPVSTIWTKTDF